MAYINATEVKAIREALKTEFGKSMKFSVRKGAGGLSVTVSIMKGDVDFSELWSGKTEGDYNYGYFEINQYWIERNHTEEHAKIFNKIVEIIKTAPYNAGVSRRPWFDESDAMTDYFHTAYYFHLEVGAYDKPYENTATVAA